MSATSTPAYIFKTNARSRNIKISIRDHDKVMVVSPPLTPRFIINMFVKKSQPWIEAQLAKLATRPQQQDFASLTNVALFGQNYPVRIEYSSQNRIGIYVQNNELIINPVSPEPTPRATQNQLDRFLKLTAQQYIVKRAHTLGQEMKTMFGSITLRHQKTRWGSCNSRGNLNFQWRLVHVAPEVSDYVIIHELAHRTHMNHSQQFWRLVGQFDPEFRKHVGFLKRHSMAVG